MEPDLTTGDAGPLRTAGLDRFSRSRESAWASIPGELSTRLLGWLRDHLGDRELEYASAPIRLGGGTDTLTYGFALRSAPREFGSELVLRLFPSGHDPRRAAKEGFIQNALVHAGYPVARVYATCANPTILGGSFLVMRRLPGVPMLRAAPTELPEMLGAAHASLHDGNSDGVVATLGDRQWWHRKNALDSLLGNMHARTAVFPQFEAIVGWLLENRPPEPDRETVCHGDFHPLNILVREGAVSGVLDWANFAVGDPAADVAFTMMAVAVVGRHVFEVPDAAEVAARYLACYRAHRRIDADRLLYHRIKHSTLALLCGADGRSLWRHPPIAEELVGWLHARTGVAIGRPPTRAVSLP